MDLEVGKITRVLVDCIKSGGKALTFGVGGNAATAIHFAAELAGKFEEYEAPLPCIDLCSNPSVLTAITNDFGWEYVFSRQIAALAKPGDVVVAFSISTKGDYLLEALIQALPTCRVVLMCGRSTLELTSSNLVVYELGSDSTPWVQEEQLRLVHLICRQVKSLLL